VRTNRGHFGVDALARNSRNWSRVLALDLGPLGETHYGRKEAGDASHRHPPSSPLRVDIQKASGRANFRRSVWPASHRVPLPLHSFPLFTVLWPVVGRLCDWSAANDGAGVRLLASHTGEPRTSVVEFGKDLDGRNRAPRWSSLARIWTAATVRPL
jgi:hypothetical protein